MSNRVDSDELRTDLLGKNRKQRTGVQYVCIMSFGRYLTMATEDGEISWRGCRTADRGEISLVTPLSTFVNNSTPMNRSNSIIQRVGWRRVRRQPCLFAAQAREALCQIIQTNAANRFFALLGYDGRKRAGQSKTAPRWSRLSADCKSSLPYVSGMS